MDRVLQLPQGEALLREILSAFASTSGQARLIMSATTQSGQQGLPALLQQHSTILALPDIGDGFVLHLAQQYQQLTQSKRQNDSLFGKLGSPYQGITWGQADEGILLDAFQRLQRIPYYFRALVEDWCSIRNAHRRRPCKRNWRGCNGIAFRCCRGTK